MSVDWGNRPSKKQKPNSASALDAFVQPQRVGLKRLNINIPSELHRRIKVQCALRDQDMTEAIIELLEKSFPE